MQKHVRTMGRSNSSTRSGHRSFVTGCASNATRRNLPVARGGALAGDGTVPRTLATVAEQPTERVTDLPLRAGSKPDTHNAMPHQQLSQNAPPELQEELFARAAGLPGVRVGPSGVSVPGARAFVLEEAAA